MSILNYFEKVPKNPLQAMSSAPKEEAGRHVGVVNLTKREIEEVTNEVTTLETKVESEELHQVDSRGKSRNRSSSCKARSQSDSASIERKISSTY